eukprot:10740773-Heterocapsa_arctica.AAC.1
MAMGSPDGSPGKWVDNGTVWLRDTGIQPQREDESSAFHPGAFEPTNSSTPLQCLTRFGHPR